MEPSEAFWFSGGWQWGIFSKWQWKCNRYTLVLFIIKIRIIIIIIIIIIISKIKLVGYHQWCTLIGRATSRLSSDSHEYELISKQTERWLLNRVLQKTTVVFSESTLITRFQTLRFPTNKRRTRELENWKRKLVQTPRRSNQAQKAARCCGTAFWKRRDWTVKPLVFLISHWRFIR